MDALAQSLRSRLSSALEWAVAALFLAATLAVGALLIQDLRLQVLNGRPAEAGPPVTASVPASIPERALSVPLLPLADGTELRIGDTAAAVAERLGRAAESGRQEVGRGSLGERLTRFYEVAGTRFILVFEPFERNGDFRRRRDLPQGVQVRGPSAQRSILTRAALSSFAEIVRTGPFSGIVRSVRRSESATTTASERPSR